MADYRIGRLRQAFVVCALAGLLAGVPLAASAFAATGSVWTWGGNRQGQLGNGSTTAATVPVAVQANATAIAAGFDHSLAVLQGGSVVAWGSNQFGQLGTSSGSTKCAGTPCSKVPLGVSGLSGVVAVAAGVHFSLALLSNGTVMAWGENEDGQLGDGTSSGPTTCGSTPCSKTPVAVSGLSNVKAIAAGGSHALALLHNGRVMAWGANNDGQLGDESNTGPTTCDTDIPCSPLPVPVAEPDGAPLGHVAEIAAGGAFSLAQLNFSVGQVDAWGDNLFGQLGDGSTSGPITCANGQPCSPTPRQVSGLNDPVGVAASGAAAQAVALDSDGLVAAWGDNEFGQVGNGCSTSFCPHPMLEGGVSGVTAIATAGGTNSFRSMALESTGQAVEWGTPPLGDPSAPLVMCGVAVCSINPVDVSGMTAASAIAAGGAQSLALAPPPPNRYGVQPTLCRNCQLVALKVHLPYPGLLSVIQVPVPQPGPLAASAPKKPLIFPVTVHATHAGTVKLKLRLTAAGKRALQAKGKQGKLNVKVLITFTPTGGSPRSKTITVTFTKRRR